MTRIKKPARPAEAVTAQAAAKMFGIQPNELTKYFRNGLRNWRKGTLTYVLPEDVRQWRVDHAQKSSLARAAKDSPVGGGEVVTAETSMDRLIKMEQQAFSDYLAAREARNMMAIRGAMKAYGDIAKIVTEAQRRDSYIEEIKSDWWADTSETIRKWCEPIRALIDQMPRSLAQQCNPTDPTAAEGVLIIYRDKQLLPLMAKTLKV